MSVHTYIGVSAMEAADRETLRVQVESRALSKDQVQPCLS